MAQTRPSAGVPFFDCAAKTPREQALSSTDFLHLSLLLSMLCCSVRVEVEGVGRCLVDENPVQLEPFVRVRARDNA